MADRPKNTRSSVSAYRPTLMEELSDTLIGAPLRTILESQGLSSRDAFRKAQMLATVPEKLTNLSAAEQGVRQIASHGGSLKDYANIGLASLPFAGLLGKAVAPMAKEAAIFRPSVLNTVVPEASLSAKTGIISGRALNTPEQVTHASRKISSAELDSVLKSGHFINPKGGTKHTREGGVPINTKWWSAADESGTFGRDWAKGSGGYTVRVPIGLVPAKKAVSAKDAEIYDKALEAWVPLSEYIKRKK